MNPWLLAGAIFNLAFAIFHLAFWQLFDWRNELPRLGFVNRQILQILNLCLTFVFLLFGWLLLAHSGELIGTRLGRTLLAGISMFWVLRAIEQTWFFGLKDWRSLVFLAVFVSGALIHVAPLVA